MLGIGVDRREFGLGEDLTVCRNGAREDLVARSRPKVCTLIADDDEIGVTGRRPVTAVLSS